MQHFPHKKCKQNHCGVIIIENVAFSLCGKVHPWTWEAPPFLNELREMYQNPFSKCIKRMRFVTNQRKFIPFYILQVPPQKVIWEKIFHLRRITSAGNMFFAIGIYKFEYASLIFDLFQAYNYNFTALFVPNFQFAIFHFDTYTDYCNQYNVESAFIQKCNIWMVKGWDLGPFYFSIC